MSRNGETDVGFLHHEPCPECGSDDNMARYDDGHGYCFGCEHYEKGDGDDAAGSGDDSSCERSSPLVSRNLLDGEVIALRSRRISEDTCAKFGYRVGTNRRGKVVHIADYKNDRGQVVAQKTRTKSKKFHVIGNLKEALPLWGQWLWRDGGKKVVITEGELDCMSMSQMQGNKWPVVSVPNGAAGARKAVKQAVEWLHKFDEVVFMFDQDEPGEKAAIACASVLKPGRASIASLPLKDANEMLMAGRGGELIDAMWGAKPYRPDGIITMGELKEEILKPVNYGLPWPWQALTDATYGRRRGEVYGFGAGTGIGKTDLFTQIIAQTVVELGLPVGLFYLEQEPVETARRVAGKVAHKRFHVPDAGWTQDELLETWDKLMDSGKIYLYNHFGCTEWEIIESRIRYLVHACGVKDIFLDHLTALAAAEDDERKALERIMADIGSLVKELDITLYFISHLATPEGRPHEEGGRVMIRHFKGSRAIGYWCHFMFGMERDQQAEDMTARHTTTFRILKDRYTGQSTGMTFFLGYDADTGLLYEKPDEAEDLSDDNDEFSYDDIPF